MASEPDVIFVSGRLVKKIPELRRIAPVIYQKTDRELGSLEQTKAKLVQLGGIFGKTAEAEAAGRAFDERAAAIRTAVVGMVTSSHFNILGLRSKPASRQKITQSPETKQTLLLKALFNRGFFLAPRWVHMI